MPFKAGGSRDQKLILSGFLCVLSTSCTRVSDGFAPLSALSWITGVLSLGLEWVALPVGVRQSISCYVSEQACHSPQGFQSSKREFLSP